MTKKIPKPQPKDRGGKSAKQSGNYFEYMAEDYFDKSNIASATRIVGSGAFGKISREPRLLGDLHIDFDILNHPILAELKFGYGGPTQITIKKEWIEKITQEAELTNRYPALIFKFKGARGKNSRMIAFSWEVFMSIMKDLAEYIAFLEKKNG